MYIEMATVENDYNLTGSLEDYLETIFELVRDKKITRTRLSVVLH